MDSRCGDKQGSRLVAISTGASFVLSFSLLALYWARHIFSEYFPYGDEFALLVNSARPFHPSALSWLTEGYSHYLNAYPGWTVPYTNFLRPVANVCYYFNSLIFASHWSCYLLLTDVIQSGIAATSLTIGSRRLHLPLRYAAISSCLCFVSPAFGPEAMFSPSFAFDLLAALLVLLGINQFLQNRLLIACLFFAIAIFTKGTALFAPITAAFLVAGDARRNTHQRVSTCAIFLLPIMAWGLLRRVAFHG